eukprot:4630205-Ditylum_brightwellii.AAC.2
MVEKSDEMKINLTDIHHDESIASSMMIGSAETRYMYTLVREYVVMDIHPNYQKILHDANEAVSILGEVSSLCNSLAIHQLLSERGEISQISYTLRSKSVSKESILNDHWEF